MMSVPQNISVLFIWWKAGKTPRIVCIEVTGTRADGSSITLHYDAFDPQPEQIAFWRSLAATCDWTVIEETRG